MTESDRGPFGFSLLRHVAVGGAFLLLPAGSALAYTNIDESVTAPGRLDYRELTPVTTRIPTRIEEVRCREGQLVREGDVLFVLDPAEMRTQHDQLVEKIRGLRTTKEQNEKLRQLLVTFAHPSEIAAIEADLKVLTVDERSKETIFRRRQALLAQGLASQEDFDLAKGEHELAVSRREEKVAAQRALASQHQLKLEELDRVITSLDAELKYGEAALPLAKRRLDDATVRAPISGVVLTPTPERLRGQRVEPGQTIVELGDPANHEFVMTVDERDVSKVSTGQEVIVQMNAFPYYVFRTFRGTVESISSIQRHDGARDGSDAPPTFRVMVALREPVVGLQVNHEEKALTLRSGLSGNGTVIVNRGIGIRDYLFRRIERRAPKTNTIY